MRIKLMRGDTLEIEVEGTESVITCTIDGATFTIDSDMPDAQERCCHHEEGFVYTEHLNF